MDESYIRSGEEIGRSDLMLAEQTRAATTTYRRIKGLRA
jgi:hypothetical protein